MLSIVFLLKYLTLACYVSALQQNVTRNTIFADEKLEGEIFESVDIFTKLKTNKRNHLDYRLPKTTRPIHYNLHWFMTMSDMTFAGTVEIQLTATQANVNEIVIHSHDLTLSSVSLMSGTTLLSTTTTEEPDLHFLRVQLTSGTLEYNAENPIIYSLSISFVGPFRDDMSGIYKSWYRNSWNDPDVSWMASTQFAATSARFAFPCYDEPSFKATFDIVITRPATFKSWSNTLLNEIRDTLNPVGYQEDYFVRTPIMSTYLLAFVVAEYDSSSVYDPSGLMMYEVIGRPGAISYDQASYALEVGQQITEAMSEHTGIDYFSVSSNLKMTHAAIPDFSFGAMENWGLIVYREAYIMYDPIHTSDHYRQLIAYLLGHEIAHMWYGNLVTLEFWNNMWLNEGFARYYQYFLTHMVKENMGLDSRFITEQVHTALLSDSANNPHPLTNPSVGSPESVYAMFSTLSYNKGAAIIRMTEHLLGSNVHRLGLQNYLIERYLDVAVPNDLFQALQVVAISSGAIDAYGPDFSVSDYYRSWTEQGGHPVLYVDVNHKTGDMTIQQRRFNINTGYSLDTSKWIIPITFASASSPDFANTKPSHIISQAVTVINRGSVGDEWTIFNKQQTGFYRVNYDEYTWDLIMLALNGENRISIHEYNRAQIVDDAFQFARSGIMSYSRALNILSFLENETEYTPWVAAMTGFNWLRNRLAGTHYLAPLERLIARWATRLMNELTYNPLANESFMRSYLRWQLAPVMCAMNVRACRDAANAQFRALITSNTEVPINNRNWVYCNGLREGSESDFDFLWQRYQTHNVYTEKIQILQFIGCTPHASRINLFLSNIVEDNFVVRQQDYSVAFNSVLTGNEENTLVVLRFIQNNLPAVTKAFGSAATPLSNVAARLRSISEVNMFLNWLEENKNEIGDAYEVVVANAELTRQSISWVADIQDDLNNYFVNGDDDISTSTAAPVTSPSTVTPSDLIEPETPNIPDSAHIKHSPTFVLIILSIYLIVTEI